MLLLKSNAGLRTVSTGISSRWAGNNRHPEIDTTVGVWISNRCRQGPVAEFGARSSFHRCIATYRPPRTSCPEVPRFARRCRLFAPRLTKVATYPLARCTSRPAPPGRSWSCSGRTRRKPSRSITLQSAFFPAATASITQAVELCRVLRKPMDGVLDAHPPSPPATAHPVRQHVGVHAGVTYQPDVGTAVPQTLHRDGVLHHLEEPVVAVVPVVEERPEQKLPAFVLEHGVIGDRPRIHPEILCYGADAGGRGGLVLEIIPEHIDVVEGSSTDLVHEEGPTEIWLLGENASTHLGVTHASHPLGQREIGQFGRGRWAGTERD